MQSNKGNKENSFSLKYKAFTKSNLLAPKIFPVINQEMDSRHKKETSSMLNSAEDKINYCCLKHMVLCQTYIR